MALVDDLIAAREGAAAKLAAALTGDYSNAIEFKPDGNGPLGVNRAEYIRELRETIKFLDSEISKADGAFEVTSTMSA